MGKEIERILVIFSLTTQIDPKLPYSFMFSNIVGICCQSPPQEQSMIMT
jgi:hypothetical protein